LVEAVPDYPLGTFGTVPRVYGIENYPKRSILFGVLDF
jgi:hypothetical protein